MITPKIKSDLAQMLDDNETEPIPSERVFFGTGSGTQTGTGLVWTTALDDEVVLCAGFSGPEGIAAISAVLSLEGAAKLVASITQHLVREGLDK